MTPPPAAPDPAALWAIVERQDARALHHGCCAGVAAVWRQWHDALTRLNVGDNMRALALVQFAPSEGHLIELVCRTGSSRAIACPRADGGCTECGGNPDVASA